MLVRVTTINEETVNFNSDKSYKNYVVSNVYVNPLHIVCLKEDLQYIELNVQKRLPEGFDDNQKFTRIFLARGNMAEELTVIGEIKGIATKINEVLNGN